MSQNQNPRRLALSLLGNIIGDKIPLNAAILDIDSLPAQTRALIGGVCRYYTRLELIADTLVSKRPKQLNVWLTILMGLYLIMDMDIPDYAAVNECVSMIKSSKERFAAAMVNAVLRRFIREREEILAHLQKNDAWQLNLGAWFKSLIFNDWPEHAREIAKSHLSIPLLCLRVNTRFISRDDYLEQLSYAGINAFKHQIIDSAILIEGVVDVKNLPGFNEGLFAVSDASAQIAATLMDLKPNLKVLDACCAPGGKLMHMLSLEPDLSHCLGLEIEPKRLSFVHDNLKRLQCHATLINCDAKETDKWWDGTYFDRILLDAPCSALGIIRRHPDIQLLRSQESLNQAVLLQKELLSALWPTLAIGGRLVYATCSIAKVENEYQIKSFLEAHQDAVLLPVDIDVGYDRGYGRQILPDSQQHMDGFFYSIIMKKEH